MLIKKIASIPQFIRRWKNLLATAGVLTLLIGGGVYYWFAIAAEPASAAKPEQVADTARAHSATEELKNLFAEEAEEDFDQVPLVDTTEKELPEVESTKVESLPVVKNSVGDRYASWAVADPEPEAAEEHAEMPADPPSAEEPAEERLEIARGQDPGDNPLRASRQAVQQAAAYDEVNEENARTAFAEAAPIAGYPAAGGVPSGAPQASTSFPADSPAIPAPQPNAQTQSPSGNPFASAPSASGPLPAEVPQQFRQEGAAEVEEQPPLHPESTQSSSGYPAPQGNYTVPLAQRYGALEPTPAAPAPTTPPVVDLGAQTGNLIPQEPTPAYPLEQTRVASSTPLNGGLTKNPGINSTLGSGRPGERMLEGSQSPSLSIQKMAPAEIQVGKRCVFAIRIQNTGQRTAQNVQIHDQIPAGTELIGTAPKASVTGGEVVWDLGTLSVGEERTVEMELVPTEEGELGSVATVTMAAQASAKARCTKPELALRLTSNPEVHVGDQQLVQIEISNPGTGIASGVMLLENVPAGVSHEAGPALEFEVGTLAPGETRRLDLVLTAEQAGNVINAMTARSDSGLVVEASCEFEVIAPELRLSIEGPDRRFLERPATYHVSIDNPGTAAAKEVQLVTHLPKGLQFVSANNLGEYDAAAHCIYWSLAELPANERGTVELVALPVEPGQHTLQVSSKARDGLTDQTEKQVAVEGIAAIMFEVVDRDDPIEVGGETSYNIRVVNQGSKAATNVQVVAVMPPGLRALAGHGDTRHTVQGDRIVFEPVAQLGPKAESTFRVQVQGVRAGDQRLSVQITTDEIRDPITKEESTRVYSDQ